MRNDATMKHDAVDPNQVSPKPWYETAAGLDRAAIVEQKMREHPGASAGEIVALLALEHVEVSATLVMQEMGRVKPRPTS